VADLGSKLAAAEAKLASVQAEAEALRTSLAAAQATIASMAAAPVPPTPQTAAPRATSLDKDVKASALEAKARALELLGFYIERIVKDGSK
jgi:multidrug resistance efflux pump